MGAHLSMAINGGVGTNPYFHSDYFPVYDSAHSYHAVIGSCCRPPSVFADDWMQLRPEDLMDDSAVRISTGDVEIAIDRSAMGRNMQCMGCHGRRCARPWGLWTRRSWLEERMEDFEDRLECVEGEQLRRAYGYGMPGGFGFGGNRHFGRRCGRPVMMNQRYSSRYAGSGGWGGGGRHVGGINLEMINNGYVNNMNLVDAPMYRGRRTMRNGLLPMGRYGCHDI